MCQAHIDKENYGNALPYKRRWTRDNFFKYNGSEKCPSELQKKILEIIPSRQSPSRNQKPHDFAMVAELGGGVKYLAQHKKDDGGGEPGSIY